MRSIGSLFGLCKVRFRVSLTVLLVWIKYFIHARQLTPRSKRKIEAPSEKAAISEACPRWCDSQAVGNP